MPYKCKRCGNLWSVHRTLCWHCGAVWTPYQREVYHPTVQEIRAACQRIQTTWSPAEEQKRRASAYRAIPVDYYETDAGILDSGRVNRKDSASYDY